MDIEKRVEAIQKHVEKMNDELGDLFEAVAEIRGELKWIRYIIIGTFLAALIQIILNFIPV